VRSCRADLNGCGSGIGQQSTSTLSTRHESAFRLTEKRAAKHSSVPGTRPCLAVAQKYSRVADGKRVTAQREGPAPRAGRASARVRLAPRQDGPNSSSEHEATTTGTGPGLSRRTPVDLSEAASQVTAADHPAAAGQVAATDGASSLGSALRPRRRAVRAARQKTVPSPQVAAVLPSTELPEAPAPPRGAVVLALGRQYFHDGTVGQGHYANELPPTLVAAVQSLQLLSRAILTQCGASVNGEITVESGSWCLRLGPGVGEAQLLGPDGVQAVAPAHPERRAQQWLRGIAALREADHAGALSAFEAEAVDAAEKGAPQRAAVAYRAAAASARSSGRSDQANRFLRLAGKYYLEIAESPSTLPQGVFSAYREAARAFLDAGNLPLAQQCLSKALTVGGALGLVEQT